MAGYDELSSRGAAASSMKRSSFAPDGSDGLGGPDAGPDDSDPSKSPDDNQDVAMQTMLDAIEQGADAYGEEVSGEIRAHVNAIRELISQGEAGASETQDDGQDADQMSPDAQSSADTAGNESNTPATQATDNGGGFPA